MTTFQRIIKYCALALAVFLIVTIIGGIVSAVGILAGFFGSSEPVPMSAYAVSGHIEKLDVEISAASLRIVTGDSFSLESNDKYLTVTTYNGTLKINEEKVPFAATAKDITVVLTVPRDFTFTEAVIQTGAGTLQVDALQADKLSLELGAGETEIGTLRAQTRSDINTGAGKLTIRDGVLHNLSMEVGVGKMVFTGQLTGSCEVEFGIGDAELTLVGSSADYRISLDKGLGEAIIDGNVLKNDSTFGTGSNQVDIESGIGSIRIDFSES